jgi:CubicO group peptidase (beta-lactamase class C family)
LEPIREKHKLPALAGAIVTEQGMVDIGAVGAPTNTLWQIGSNTKAMAAALIAKLVEQGKLKWETGSVGN